MKVCTKCGEQKPLAMFSFKKNGLPGLKPACKKCHAAATRARYALDPSYYLRYAAESRKNPAVRKRINDRRNAARREDPALELWRLARTRARLKGIPFGIDVSDVQVPALCPVLGVALVWGCAKRQIDQSPTVDRVIPERGYVKGNVRVISWRANRIKSDATLSELLAVAQYLQSAVIAAGGDALPAPFERAGAIEEGAF